MPSLTEEPSPFSPFYAHYLSLTNLPTDLPNTTDECSHERQGIAPSMMQRLIVLRHEQEPAAERIGVQLPPRASGTLRAPSAAAYPQHVNNNVSCRKGRLRWRDHIWAV